MMRTSKEIKSFRPTTHPQSFITVAFIFLELKVGGGGGGRGLLEALPVQKAEKIIPVWIGLITEIAA